MARLERFLRDERDLCAYAVVNLRPEHFEDYRDRRLREPIGRTGRTVSPSTVKRELGLFKRVIDFRRRRLGIIVNPVNMDDVKRPLVIDERDVRLVRGTEYTFPMIFLH